MDNRRLIIAVVLCIALLIGWQTFSEYMGWMPEQPQPTVTEEQAAPVQQNEEAAPDSVKAEEEQTAHAPEQMAGKSEHDGEKPEQTPPAAGSFEVARVLKVTKPLMRGDDVKALQTALIERNYHCGTNGADGTYGRLTAYAVRCFQASKGLIVNGRADRYTIAALGGTWKE